MRIIAPNLQWQQTGVRPENVQTAEKQGTCSQHFVITLLKDTRFSYGFERREYLENRASDYGSW